MGKDLQPDNLLNEAESKKGLISKGFWVGLIVLLVAVVAVGAYYFLEDS